MKRESCVISGIIVLFLLRISVYAEASGKNAETIENKDVPGGIGITGDTDSDSSENASETQVDFTFDEITVTASRIRRSGLTTPTPTTVISAEEIDRTGVLNIIQIVTNLPQVGFSSLTDEISNFSFGDAGLNFASLRNLGPRRTLSLVDGRRTIGTNTMDADNIFAFDVTTLPPALIKSIEIITGGASAVYGADAVAGVINYRLKDDFEGTTIDSQYGISEEGDGGRYNLSLITGKNFWDGRGNAVLSISVSDSEEILFGDRSQQTESVLSFFNNPANTGPDDGIPDQIAIGSLRFIDFGIHNATVNSRFNLDGSLGTTTNVYSFNADGTPFLAIPGDEFVGTFATRNPFGGIANENSQAVVPLERYNTYSRIRFDLSESLRLEISGRYSRVETNSSYSPVFAIEGRQSDQVSADNPFVTDELRLLLGGADSVSFSREFAEFGNRMVDITRDFFTLSTGLSGELPNGWLWDVHYKWGGTKTENIQRNDRLDARYVQALDAIIDPVTGEIVCRDPSNGCVPLNPFGPEGTVTPEVVDFLSTEHTTNSRIEQHLLTLSITGDLFYVPAGPLSFALGGEFRRESLDYDPSTIFREGGGFGGFQFFPIDESNTVKEGFGELLLPLFSELPLIKAFNLEGAVRIADYQFSGTNTSWKVGIDWRINESIRIRSTFAQAIRAPALGEMFNPGSQDSENLFDPCDEDNVGENPNRMANCVELGITQPFIALTRSLTTKVTSKGNPDLDVEEADTFTLGVVLTPTLIPNFTVTLDYYDIDLKDAITQFGAQEVLDNCVDLPGVNNEFCDAVQRGPDGNIIEVLDTFINASGFRIKGFDLEAHYDLDLQQFSPIPGIMQLRFFAGYLDTYEFVQVAEDSRSEIQELDGERWNPKLRTNLRIMYDVGPFDITWRTRYIDSMRNSNTASSEFRSPDSVPSYWRHDLNIGYELHSMVRLTMGADNVFDEEPPHHPFSNTGNNFYSLVGRFYYAGAQIHF